MLRKAANTPLTPAVLHILLRGFHAFALGTFAETSAQIIGRT